MLQEYVLSHEDVLFTVLRCGGVRILGMLRATCSDLSQRCRAHESRLYCSFLCSTFGVLVSDTEECGDAALSLGECSTCICTVGLATRLPC